MFERKLSTDLRSKLKQEPLFIKRLLPDIKSDNVNDRVFPAIRKNVIDFYFKGGNLFSFNGTFRTHRKYASIYKHEKKYLSEVDLNNIKPISNFIDDYEEIKKNCARYSGAEREGISNVYSKYSYACSNENITVLDIEIAFSNDNASIDMPDFLIFNCKKKLLRFYEAKHFSNSEIWAAVNTKPKVVKQIGRYNTIIEKNKDRIVCEYQNYIEHVNELFQLELPKPQEVNSNVGLVIFGFDRDQLQGRFEKLIKDDKSLDGINYYPIGEIKGLIIDNLWKKTEG